MSQETPSSSGSSESNQPLYEGRADSDNRGELYDAQNKEIARKLLHENSALGDAINSRVKAVVEQALNDNAETQRANQRADKSTVFKPGRVELKQGASKSLQKAEKYRTLKEAELQRIKNDPRSTEMFSRKSRKLARLESKERQRAKRLTHKQEVLTYDLAEAPERKREKDSERQSEGYRNLRSELASIDGLLDDRKQNRERFTDLSARVLSGELSEDNEEYDALRQYFDAVGDETDEQYRNRLKKEAVKNYGDWSKDKDRKEKITGFKNTENRLLTERLNVIDKANDPSTPIDEREMLLRQVSRWEGPDSLVEGDSGEFREWLRSNAQKEWVQAFQSADQNYQKKLQAIEQLSEELKDRKKMVMEYTDRINGATTDEEKEVLKKEAADNHTKIGDLEEKIKTLPEQAREEFDKDLFRATETFHRRQRMEKLWQG